MKQNSSSNGLAIWVLLFSILLALAPLLILINERGARAKSYAELEGVMTTLLAEDQQLRQSQQVFMEYIETLHTCIRNKQQQCDVPVLPTLAPSLVSDEVQQVLQRQSIQANSGSWQVWGVMVTQFILLLALIIIFLKLRSSFETESMLRRQLEELRKARNQDQTRIKEQHSEIKELQRQIEKFSNCS